MLRTKVRILKVNTLPAAELEINQAIRNIEDTVPNSDIARIDIQEISDATTVPFLVTITYTYTE